MAQHVPFVIEPQNKQQIAFHLRLTPQLLEALVRSQEESEPVSIQFGERDSENAITVGETHIGFNKVDENGTCDLLRLGAPGGAAVVARVKQKLMLQRNLKDEKGRFRARAEEAERERKERKMVVLSSKPVQGKGGKMEQRHSVRSVTPPPRGPTPPPRGLHKPPPTASMLAANPPQPRPPLPPGAAAAPAAAAAAAAAGGSGGRLTPPPGAAALPGAAVGAGAAGGGAAAAAAPAPKQPASKKAGAAGRLGLGKNSSTGSLASVAGGSASPAVVDAARRLGLRGALLALLLERSLNMQGVRGVLADVESKLKGSKGFKAPDKAALERALKSVAEYRNPGKYFLYDCLRKEAEEAAGAGAGAAGRELSPNSSQEAGGAEAGGGGTGGGGKSKGGGGKGAAAGGQQQQQRRAKPTAVAGGGGGGGGKRSREVTPEVGAGAGTAGKVPKLTPAQRAVASLLADPPPAAAAPAAGPAATLAATPPAASPASRATPASTGAATTTTTNTSGGGSGPQQQQQQQPGSGDGSGAKRQRTGGGTAAAAAAAAAGGAGGPSALPPGSRGHTSSSLSRGSQEFDDSWIQRHLERQPDVAGPISSKQEYHAREAAFNDKYVDYFKLHQLIEANKKDFGALRDALGAARTPGERQRYQAEIDKLYRKRGERAKRWDAAFKVLHAELAAAKQRMAEFVAAFQAQQAQQQQGPRPAAAAVPVVPVK